MCLMLSKYCKTFDSITYSFLLQLVLTLCCIYGGGEGGEGVLGLGLGLGWINTHILYMKEKRIRDVIYIFKKF